MSFSKILVALDRSHLAEEVFQHALDTAKGEQATMMLMHCTNELIEPTLPSSAGVGRMGAAALGAGWYPAPVDTKTGQHLMEKQLEGDREWLESYCQRAIAEGISTSFDCQLGEPGIRICEMARNWNADLIVVGHRGRQGLTEALLGSTSNYVLHHASCSVLAIHGSEVDASAEQEEVENTQS